jgi:hypothetical protein
MSDFKTNEYANLIGGWPFTVCVGQHVSGAFDDCVLVTQKDFHGLRLMSWGVHVREMPSPLLRNCRIGVDALANVLCSGCNSASGAPITVEAASNPDATAAVRITVLKGGSCH